MTVLTLHDYQREALERMACEPTKAILLGSKQGRGKTVMAVEFTHYMQMDRVLWIGVKDSFEDIEMRFREQSRGHVKLRRIDSTKDGKLAMADLLAGKDGYYFTGYQFLAAQDFEHRQLKNDDKELLFVLPRVANDGVVQYKVAETTAAWSVDIDGTVEKLKPKTKRFHLKNFAKMRKLDAVIFDEVHAIANRKAVTRMTLLTLKTEWKLAMSGTWFRNAFENAWSITRWLWPEYIDTNFGRWSEEWCASEPVRGKGGKALLDPYDRPIVTILGEKVPGEFVKTLPCYIFHDEPEKRPAAKIIKVDIGPTQRAQYTSLEDDLLVWLGDRPLTIEYPFTLRQRLRTATLGELSFDKDGQINFADDCESAKLDLLIPLLRTYYGQPVAVFTDSKRFAKVTVKRLQALGCRAVEWSGDVTGPKRTEIKRAFLAGEIDVIVPVIAAFNAALDQFQTVCNKVVWLSQSEDNEGGNEQAISRFFRPGRTLENGGWEETIIVAEDTHDLGMMSRLFAQKLSNRNTMSLHAA
jgi:hypothetical protein